MFTRWVDGWGPSLIVWSRDRDAEVVFTAKNEAILQRSSNGTDQIMK